MAETITAFFENLLSGLPNELIAFVISMVPIVELRGGLIYAAAAGIPLFKAILICIAGNLLPVPFPFYCISSNQKKDIL